MKTDEQVAKVLNKVCPAFVDTHTQSSVWHGCYCKAQASHAGDERQHCDCVWHLSDTCIAGTWPQLAFLSEKTQSQKVEANGWLKKAQQAITESEI